MTTENRIVRGGIGILVVDLKTYTTLLMRRVRGHDMGRFTDPGGKIDFGERAVDAAVRELSEETGIIVQDTNDLIELGHYDHIDIPNGHHYAGPTFLYLLKAGDVPTNKEPEKHDRFGMYSIDLAMSWMDLCYPVKWALNKFSTRYPNRVETGEDNAWVSSHIIDPRRGW